MIPNKPVQVPGLMQITRNKENVQVEVDRLILVERKKRILKIAKLRHKARKMRKEILADIAKQLACGTKASVRICSDDYEFEERKYMRYFASKWLAHTDFIIKNSEYSECFLRVEKKQ